MDKESSQNIPKPQNPEQKASKCQNNSNAKLCGRKRARQLVNNFPYIT